MVSPLGKTVDIPIENGFVGMVDRAQFDEWLRKRAVAAGAVREDGLFETLKREGANVRIYYRTRGALESGQDALKSVLAK